MKSSVEQIRSRFDQDVERFSRLEEGNVAQVDSRLSLELIAEAAAATNPNAQSVLDIGCGAGNYTLQVLERLPNLDVTLLDLSAPMLERASERVAAVSSGAIRTLQSDVRETDLGENQFDLILAAAVFHHLRTEAEWAQVFGQLYRALKPGGTVWIYDLVEATMPEINAMMTRRYGDYLEGLKGPGYRETVFGWIEMEDTPFPLMFQVDQLRAAGFREVEILHKHSCFAAFGGRK